MAKSNSRSRRGQPQELLPKIIRRLAVATLLVVGAVSSLMLARYMKGEPEGVAELGTLPTEQTSANTSETETASADASATQLSVDASLGVPPPPPPSVSIAQINADTQPPSIPSNIQVVRATAKSIEISWDPSSDVGGASVEGYQLFKDGKLLEDSIPQSETPRFVDTNVEIEKAYTYAISAFDTVRNRSSVRQITVRTPPEDIQPPNIPSNLRLLSSDSTNATLAWDESVDPESGLLGYKVFRDGQLVAQITEPWFHDSGLQEQSDYVYEVSALDNAEPANESAKRTITVTTQSLTDAGR